MEAERRELRQDLLGVTTVDQGTEAVLGGAFVAVEAELAVDPREAWPRS